MDRKMKDLKKQLSISQKTNKDKKSKITQSKESFYKNKYTQLEIDYDEI